MERLCSEILDDRIERHGFTRSARPTLFSSHSDTSRERIEIFLESEVGYVTLKIDVRAAVFDEEDRGLLVEETDGFALPGGWADPRESASEGAVRETLEETGWLVEILRLGAVLDRESSRSF